MAVLRHPNLRKLNFLSYIWHISITLCTIWLSDDVNWDLFEVFLNSSKFFTFLVKPFTAYNIIWKSSLHKSPAFDFITNQPTTLNPSVADYYSDDKAIIRINNNHLTASTNLLNHLVHIQNLFTKWRFKVIQSKYIHFTFALR